MKTTVSSKGQIVLPAEIRRQDGIEAGQEFEVERLDRGEYRLKRTTRRRNEGLVKLLLACPAKGWFTPMERTETTDDVRTPALGMTHLVDANVLSEPTKPVPSSKVIDWLTVHEGEIVVDSIVLGELCIGVLALPPGRKRAQLEQWFAAMVQAIDREEGCSMATPHVTGLAAMLMDHYPDLRGRPALLRAHMMATAMGHDGATAPSDDYGLGRVSGYLAHWDHPNSAGWTTHRFWGGVNSQGFRYEDITVPPGAKQLIVVLTWDEPPTSAGASRAVTYDLDLWLDHEASCVFGDCGEYSSVSTVDNVEYVVVENPPPGLYRLKVYPFNAPSFNLPYGLVARIVRGDPTPAIHASLTAPEAPKVGTTFQVTLSAATLSYVVSGTYMGRPFGNGQRDHSHRHAAQHLLPPGLRRRPGLGGGRRRGQQLPGRAPGAVTVTWPDLIAESVSAPPATVKRGGKFPVTDTARNLGAAASGTSKTRYYLSLDGTRSAGDKVLSANRSVSALAAGASHTGTVTVTVPAATPLNTYVLLACVDGFDAVVETNEANNCAASGTTVTVTP